MLLSWLAAAVLAGPEEESPSPDVEARIAAMEAELAAMRDQLQEAELEALLREAESLAALSPPPPPPPPSSAAAFNPAITAFGDALASVGLANGAIAPGSGPWLRSLELDIRAVVDPFAKAVAIFAVEQEPPLESGTTGEFEAAPEELYVDLVALPGGLSARAGGFRQPFGITNRAHPHDNPWPDTPMPLAALLGEEGLNQVGATLAWQIPNPWHKGFSLTGGLNDGSRFDPRGRTAAPAALGRAEYFDRAGPFDWGLGGTATGLLDPDLGGSVVGGDLMVRYRPNIRRSVVLLGEILTDGEALGGYGALQLQPLRSVYLGARLDHLDQAWLAGGAVSYYTSEFLRFRAGARVDGEGAVSGDAQLTFVWGSHPVEPYWVNR